MKSTLFVFLLFVFAICMSVQGIAQDDQGGRIGAGTRSLRTDVMHLDKTNPSMIMKNHRTERAKILAGVRRLVPQVYSTIQAAINSSDHGDTILVSDGIYVENIWFRGKAITVASLYLVDGDTAHIEQTIIDGRSPSNPDSASVVYFVNGEDTTSVLCGFTITGGEGTPLPRGSNSDVYQSGGGVFCSGVFGAKIINNRITENQVSGDYAQGGGVYFGVQGSLILEKNHIFSNNVIAVLHDGMGGGVVIDGESGVYARIVENVFEWNTVVAQTFAISGAVDFASYGVLMEGVIQGNVFRENMAEAMIESGLCGGLYCYGTAAVEIRDNLFESNIAKSRDAYAEGGGLIIDDTEASGYGRKMVIGNRFVNNLASTQFGTWGRGGAIEIFNTHATVSRNYFEQNTAQGGTAGGGAIRIYSSYRFRIENNIFTENTAIYGGAVYVSGTSEFQTERDFVNNTIVNNTATSLNGGGIYADRAIVLNSILWGNSRPQITVESGGSIEVQYSDIELGWEGDGNMDSDPLFVNTTTYYLSENSPCIDKGNPEIIYNDLEDPDNLGFALWPAMGTLLNDMGAYGGNPDLITGIGDDRNKINYIPLKLELKQNYPNPFNPTTIINYELPITNDVNLSIYNMLGQKVAVLVSEKQSAGSHQVEWNASGYSSGMYYYRIEAGEFQDVKKMILLK